MERLIDFSRDRHMLCGSCGQRFLVGLDWIDRWVQGQEKCPGCALTCEHEDAPRVTVDPADPALDDDRVSRLSWYHTSTHPDWPSKDFDPAAGLTAETRQLMGGDQRVAAWAARQRRKALHAGTYEAAVHNMLRRGRDQADQGSQFYLYRVILEPSVVVRADWLIDPSDFVGDVMLDEVCPPGVDVARYLNYHEDPGGLSLALGRDAIAGVQRVAVPLADAWDENWVHDTVETLANTTTTLAPATGTLSRFRRPSSPRVLAGNGLGAALAQRLPVNLQHQFISATTFADGDDLARWARRTSGLFEVIEHPERVLAALDAAELRHV
jgi:hypothetical protein